MECLENVHRLNSNKTLTPTVYGVRFIGNSLHPVLQSLDFPYNNRHMENHICRVCGYLYDVPIWNDFGEALLDESCPCCGVQWGEQDVTLEQIRAYRRRWLESGAPWVWPAIQPDDWELEHQLVNIPKAFR